MCVICNYVIRNFDPVNVSTDNVIGDIHIAPYNPTLLYPLYHCGISSIGFSNVPNTCIRQMCKLISKEQNICHFNQGSLQRMMFHPVGLTHLSSVVGDEFDVIGVVSAGVVMGIGFEIYFQQD